MLFQRIRKNDCVDDEEFDRIYPDKVRQHSENHFTPVKVALEAAAFLTSDGPVQVLDVGSGAGKFCTVGSASTPGHFTGVEQRKSLHEAALEVMESFRLERIQFFHANILDFPFGSFDAVYFFNSFQENISPMDKMNDEVELKRNYYKLYGCYLKDQLAGMQTGTRLVTYHGFLDEVPDSFVLKGISPDRHLRMWTKMN